MGSRSWRIFINKQTLILGPPGTGKTHRLLDIVDEELKSTPPDKIASLSFTRKATEEARQRALDRFNYEKTDLPWFRTLHSLAYQRLGLRRTEVLQPRHLREIGHCLGITFSGKQTLEEGLPTSIHAGDRYSFIDGFARARQLTPEAAYRLCAGDGEDELNWWEFRRYRETLTAYKRERSLVDYPDMLDLPQAPLAVDVVVIDEAQDLSTQQWAYLRRVVLPYAKRVYIAGDDDQAIYQWSGADVAAFLALEGTKEVLHRSRRVPVAVHRVATGLSQGIQRRFEKSYAPKAATGAVSYHSDPADVDLGAPGSWLLLARNGYLLARLAEVARSQGIPYSLRGESMLNPAHLRAIEAWGRFSKGLSYDVEALTPYLPRNATPGELRGRVWHDVLVGLPSEDLEFYRAVHRRGEKLFAPPRVDIGTIHSVKGGEADNVLLLTDISAKTHRSAEVDRDAELRVWYVAVTRAAKNLHIITPQGGYGWEV